MHRFKIEFEDAKLNLLYENLLKERENYAKIAENEIKNQLTRLNHIYEKYKNQCELLYKNAVNAVIRKEFANKGENLHRGYYCPSPITDIVLGNASRGRILKRITSRSKPSYEYGFDKLGQLCIAHYLYLDEFDDNHVEVILHDNKCEIGILFSINKNGHTSIESICESVFDDSNRIKSFILGHIVYKNQIDEIEIEKYYYDESGLKTVETYSWVASIYSGEKYIFKHSNNGFLSEYVCEPRMYPDEKFQVNIERKI